MTIQDERSQFNGQTATRHREERVFGRVTRIIAFPALAEGNATQATYTIVILEARAARSLGISRRTFYRLLDKHDLSIDKSD